MIDIVTVVFGEEVAILRCQAQSLDLYCQDIGLQKIYVMVNEPNLSQEIDTAWWGSLAGRVEIVPRETFDVDWSDNGWLTQQLLKIHGGARSQNIWTMVLDAKTIMTRRLALDDVINSQGQAKFGWLPIDEVFYPARDIANQLLETNNTTLLEPVGVPFFFHNQSVRSMIDFVQLKTNQDFDSWFLSNGMLTEFILYSTWISVDDNRRNLYQHTGTGATLNIRHVCHAFADRFDQILASHDDDSHTLSVHRRVWAGLTSEQRLAFQQRLIACGITRAADLS